MSFWPGELSQVTAVILAGGLGTRLQSVVADRPKVLALVHGRPFLTYLLDQLAAAGVQHVVLCTGYKADLVRQALGTQYGAIELEYSHEEQPLGTGGALRQAVSRARSDLVLALNGDSYCAADLQNFSAAHLARGFAGSLLLAEVPDAARYGRVAFDAKGRVESFIEKRATACGGWINAGVYLLRKELLRVEPSGVRISLEQDLLPRWASQSLLGAYPSAAAFLDIGTPESYAQTENFFLTHARGSARSRRVA